VRNVFAHVIASVIRAHHEAFLVELLGEHASTVSPERIQELMADGVIDPAAIGRVHIDLGEEAVEPYEYMRLVSRALDRLDENQRMAARDWTVAQWVPYVRRELAIAREGDRHAQQETPGVRYERPEPPPAGGGADPATPIWMSPSERAAHREALARAGAYARGLGNTYAEDAAKKVVESWDGDTLSEEGNVGQRARMLRVIREKTAEAALTHHDPAQLARDLADATRYYSHNWRRIAETELQGAHNLAVVETAIDRYGEDGRVVRITESGACRHCTRLFRDAEGHPRVFTVRELLENGTNIGRKSDSWLATAWPVHPRCRCDTRIVPPGYGVTVEGRVRREVVQ